jgi:CheY-like chemotaxis protein
MITAPKTVLLVDDDDAARLLYERGLPPHLGGFAVVTAPHGRAAVDVLREHPVDVLVTDIHMPVMDGFELLAYLRERHPNIPVLVLSSLAEPDVHAEAPALGTYRVLRKPTPIPDLAGQIRAASDERVRGSIPAVPLAPLLQLMQLERKTCSLLIRSGQRKGRLHFLSGELVNAYAFELATDGEAAARHVLSWDTVSVEFERSLHNHIRTVRTPLATLLLDVARLNDERDRPPRATTDPIAAPPTPRPAAAPPDARPTAAVATGAGDLDAALRQLTSALGGLRERRAHAATALDAAAATAERIGREGIDPHELAAPQRSGRDEAATLSGQLAGLAAHLTERARQLAASADPDPEPAPPTWGAARTASAPGDPHP